jgi:hypothetical protein
VEQQTRTNLPMYELPSVFLNFWYEKNIDIHGISGMMQD